MGEAPTKETLAVQKMCSKQLLPEKPAMEPHGMYLTHLCSKLLSMTH